eukprot:CAMPEP_0113896100 /NCGR_PEP_ID=MMETSP0780_2-20120614/17788_1 /TAXON_ID=652834 /ORGANISM="Palpitomonas bilix" /LENGTH=446 /DNA_ID=CAMNT_0000887119 /DNA_START=86 /DNA_END=1426 /DNA_ORIENTATION=+ /assembly_acc=CAM_ASM_000599
MNSFLMSLEGMERTDSSTFGRVSSEDQQGFDFLTMYDSQHPLDFPTVEKDEDQSENQTMRSVLMADVATSSASSKGKKRGKDSASESTDADSPFLVNGTVDAEEKRKERVREASRRFREKRKAKIDTLEGEVAALQAEVKHLREQNGVHTEMLHAICGRATSQLNGLAVLPYNTIVGARREFDKVKRNIVPILLRMAIDMDKYKEKGENLLDEERMKMENLERSLARTVMHLEFAEDAFLNNMKDMSLRMNAGRTGFPGFFGDLVGSKLSQGSESRTLEQEVHRVMDQNEQLFILPGFIDRVLAFPMYLVLQSRIPEDLSVRMGEKRAKEIHALQVKLQREIYTVTAKKTEQGAAPVVAFIEAHSVIRKSFLDSITPLEKVDYYLVGMLGGKAIRPDRDIRVQSFSTFEERMLGAINMMKSLMSRPAKAAKEEDGDSKEVAIEVKD